LAEGEEAQFLGADSLGSIASRFVDALENRPRLQAMNATAYKPGHVWFLNLSEAHRSLYMESLEPDKIIHIVADGPTEVGRLELSNTQAALWVRQLRDVATSLPALLQPPLLYEMFRPAYLGWSVVERQHFLLALELALARRLSGMMKRLRNANLSVAQVAAIAELQLAVGSRLMAQASGTVEFAPEEEFVNALIDLTEQGKLEGCLTWAIRRFQEARTSV
jgi:hypothetical protein